MRLFFIDKPECRHISEIMSGIQAVYQMEQEFHPYVIPEFLPNNNNDPGGIIIKVGNEIIRRNYTFETPNDIKELRKLIQELIKKYHNPRDIVDDKGCIKDFRQVSKFHPIQGWQAAKRAKADICCKVITEIITRDITDFMIKHWVYRSGSGPIRDSSTCKKVRYEECGNNYAPNTPQFNRCVDEVNLLCNKGYAKGGNKMVNKTNKAVKDLRTKIYTYLDKNDMRVDKKIFDEIITAGLFEYVGNRMGNKSRNIYDVKNVVSDHLYNKGIYMKLIEDFTVGVDINTSSSNIKYALGIILILIITGYIYNGYF